MKKKLFVITSLFLVSILFAQTGKTFWKTTTQKVASTIFEDKKEFRNSLLFELDVLQLQQELIVTPKRSNASVNSNVIISFPNGEGQLEQFRIVEFSNMDPVLADKFPEIKSYLGESISNPSSKIYFSLSPLGFRSMLLNADNSSVFIEPYTTDLSSYIVYKKSDREASLSKFECKTMHQARTDLSNDQSFLARPNADDGILRTYRLAVSVTSEYTAYFGGTIPLAMAAINNTMTRVNAIFERDFGVHMNLIANNDILIYNNALTDPYSPASTGVSGNWNIELQDNLTNTIGNAGYDIGHLFAATGGGGSAGGFGLVCVDDDTAISGEPAKGSGFSSPSNGVPPSGDAFDLDTVAHEMGHQFGARHTFSHAIESLNTTQMEPGSGSTIMGYAGITGQDVQSNASAYFHAISIQQVIEFIKSKSCQITTNTSNATPSVNAGLNYTIPKSTPFFLTGSGSDINGDTITYCWEQMDIALTPTAPNATKTQGPNFRSYDPSLSPIRYFPTLTSVLSGATFTTSPEVTVEALPSVARTFNFRLTARDNRLFGAANNSDDTVITVNATAGPFLVTSPNTSVSYTGNTFQTITWDVAGTTTNGVNCATVDILLSTNGGTTFPITLASGTPNDGSQSIAIPNTTGTTNRIMIRGTNHIFFDISNTNFTIVAGTPDTTRPSTPTLSASGTTANSTLLSWTTSTDNLAVTSYDVYKDGLFLINTTLTTLNVTGLIPSSTFLFTVKAKDGAGNESLTSNTVTINTLSPDIVRPLPPTLSASLTTADTTQLSWSGATDNYSVTGYDVYQGSLLLGSTSSTTYAVTNLNAFTTYEFYVKAKDAANNTSVSSNIVTITTLQGTYCGSRGIDASGENIANVQIGTINNSSTGANGYANFTSISTPLTIGTSQTISITPRWTSNVFDEGYGVFIDYNRDGDFDDVGETVWSRSPTTLSPVSGTFTIPLTAVPGSTRMRVSMMFYGVPTPCLTYEYGEVEDYTIILNPAPISSANLSGSDTICPGDSTNVKVAITGGVSPYVLVLNNGTSNFTVTNYINNSSIPLNPSANTTYTLISVTDANGNTAGTLTGTSLITVNTLSVAPTTITGTSTICSGASITLTVSGGTLGSGATVEWFTGSCGRTFVGTGNSITVSPTTNTTYFVRYSGTCNTTTCASQLVTVNTSSVAPTAITGTSTICNGASTTLTVSGGTIGTGATVEWFTTSCGGTSTGTGNSITVSPTTNTTYFVRYNGTCNTTLCASQLVTVTTASVAPTAITGTNTICSGASTTLTVSGGTLGNGATVQWFTGSCGGTSAGTGNSITVSPTTNTTYFVRYNGSCNTTTCASQLVTVNSLSVAPTAITGTSTICSGTSTTLTVSGGTLGSGATVQWFTGSCGGTSAGTGNSITVSPTTNTTYFVRYNGTCNTTTCASRLVTVNTLSVAPTAITGISTICNGASTTLTVSGGTLGSGATVQWFTGSCGGTSAGTGNSITVSPTTNTTYFVRYNGTCNTTTCVSRLVTVNTLSVAPTAITGTSTICNGASTTLTVSGGTLGSGATVQWFTGSCGGTSAGTGTSITVSPTTNTTYFVRYSGSCNTTTCVSQLVTVNSFSTAAVISGSASICMGSFTNLQVAITGGLSPYSVVYTDGTSNFTANSYLNGSNISVAPTSSTTYSLVSVQSANGCFGTGNSGSAIVSLTSTSTNDGISWSNGLPTSAKNAIFNGNAIVGSDLTACALVVNNGAVVSVASGFDVTLDGALKVNSGSFTLENNANLIQNGTNFTNSDNIIVKRNSSALKRLDYTLWSTPVTGQGLYAFSKFTLPNRFYVYNTSTNTYNNSVGFNLTGLSYPPPLVQPNGVNGTDSNNILFQPAKGYLIRLPWDHPTTPTLWNGIFTGIPNNGTITYALSTGYNAVGNPYPSRINVHNFIDTNTTISGPLYLWRKTNDNVGTSYATLTKTAYVANGAIGGDTGTGYFNTGNESNWVLNIGQGFIVNATSNTNLTFTNSMRRSLNADQFFRSTQTTDTTNSGLYWLNLNTESGIYSQMAVGYSQDGTLADDRGIDGKNINQEFYLTSLIGADEYSIQGRPSFQETDIVPLSYKVASAGNYTVSIDHTSGLFDDSLRTIYLKDNELSTIHNLRTGVYSFATEAGIFNNRFEIVYQSQLNIPTFTSNSVIIYEQGNGFVVNSGNFVMSSIKVFDIRGRLIYEKKEINNTEAFINQGIVNQVLLIQITSTDGIVVTKKVIR